MVVVAAMPSARVSELATAKPLLRINERSAILRSPLCMAEKYMPLRHLRPWDILRAMLRWLLLVGVPVVAYLALLFVVQRSMLFPMPAQVPPAPPEGVEEVRIKFDGGEGYALYLPPKDAASAAPLLMFTHGNGEIVDYWAEEFDVARGWGVGVMLV